MGDSRMDRVQDAPIRVPDKTREDFAEEDDHRA